MRAKQLGRILVTIGRALQRGPDVHFPNSELDQLLGQKDSRAPLNPSDAPLALATLASLSAFDKSHWLNLIKEYGLPIEVRGRDASRDILGKVLTYLERNPAARMRVAAEASKGRSQTSPELMRALKILLDS